MRIFKWRVTRGFGVIEIISVLFPVVGTGVNNKPIHVYTISTGIGITRSTRSSTIIVIPFIPRLIILYPSFWIVIRPPSYRIS